MMDKSVSVAMTTQIQVPMTRVQDLIISAFEYGSRYWYTGLHVDVYPADKSSKRDFEFWHAEVPFEAGGVLAFGDAEEVILASDQKTGMGADEDELYRLDLPKIKEGLGIFARACPEQFASFLSEDDDAETGDCFLQCCIFGEVIYG